MNEVTVICANCHTELSEESYGPHNINVHPCDCVTERLRADNAKLRAYLGALLDCVDYTSGACRINEPIAGVLPRVVLDNAKAALEATK